MSIKKRTEFIVTVEIPPDCSIKTVEDYIREAVRVWCGRGSPEDPIYNLNRKSVTVKRKGNINAR